MSNRRGRYTKRYLSMRDHPVVGLEKDRPLSRNEAWQWICEEAAFMRHQIRMKGKMIWLERAQMPCGRDFLAKKWNWEPQTVRAFLAELEKEDMIKVHRSRGHYPNILEVCNYEEYQGPAHANNPVNPPEVNQRSARGQPDIKKGYTGIEKETPVVPFEEAELKAKLKADMGLLTTAQKRAARAKVEASQVPHEAQAQASVAWDDSGRIEVFDEFRAELCSKLEGTRITLADALDEAAGNVAGHLVGVPLQKAVRAQITKVARWAKNDVRKRAGMPVQQSAQRHRANPDAEFMANQEAGMRIREHLWGRSIAKPKTSAKEPAR